jgi:hypothetical protein
MEQIFCIADWENRFRNFSNTNSTRGGILGEGFVFWCLSIGFNPIQSFEGNILPLGLLDLAATR